MPTLTFNLSDADYQEARTAKNRSAWFRSKVAEARAAKTHKCPPPDHRKCQLEAKELRDTLTAATKPHSSKVSWNWEWDSKKRVWF